VAWVNAGRLCLKSRGRVLICPNSQNLSESILRPISLQRTRLSRMKQGSVDSHEERVMATTAKSKPCPF
jgi:hypothetical protein